MTCMIRIFALCLLASVPAAGQDRFSQRLTPEERKAAGLDQLTAEQIASLDALVQRERQAPVGAKKPAAVQPAAQPATTAVATEPAKSSPQKKSRLFGLPAADEENTITGTLVGEYRGWTGQTIFRLADGQIWVQEDHNDIYSVPPRQNPSVRIEKSAIGGYKLTVEGERMWVRVRRVQ